MIVFYFALFAAPASIPFLLQNWVLPQGSDWLYLLGIGLSTQLGQVCLTRGLVMLPAGRGTAIGYTQLIWAALFGVFFFGESISGVVLLGGGLILLGALGFAQRR